MIPAVNLKWFYGLVFIFLAVSLAAVLKDFYWIFLLPAALLIVLMAFYRLNTLILLAVFITPLSINLQKTEAGIGVSLPAEPVIFGIMLVFIMMLAYHGKFDKKIISHPVSILIMLHLVWMSIAAIFSTMPLVSVKAALARICFVSVFYFLATQLFRDYKNIKRFVWAYAATLVIVIIYTISRHAGYGFDEQSSHHVMNPFYNDHTAYAAVIALLIPVVAALLFEDNKFNLMKGIIFFTLLIFITAIVFSYTRAAWVSLAAAAIAFIALALKINRKIIFGAAMILLGIVISQWTQIIIKLESNTESSSTDYSAHLQSIANISTDASNVERVNRWLSALRMFDEKPVFGFGPGTYQFKYAPYQRFHEKTYISTNVGDRGSAHSEYLGPLSEQGFMGVLLFILIAVTAANQNAKFMANTKNKNARRLAIGIVLGLVTYWTHGFLNYFLDTDKASVLYWGFIAALVSLQVYHNEPQEEHFLNCPN